MNFLAGETLKIISSYLFLFVSFNYNHLNLSYYNKKTDKWMGIKRAKWWYKPSFGPRYVFFPVVLFFFWLMIIFYIYIEFSLIPHKPNKSPNNVIWANLFFFVFFLIRFIVLGGYILKVHSTYIQVEIEKCEIYSVLNQHLTTATRAVEYSPPHYVDKESWCILHRFKPHSPIKTWENKIDGELRWVGGVMQLGQPTCCHVTTPQQTRQHPKKTQKMLNCHLGYHSQYLNPSPCHHWHQHHHNIQ